jgi:hypothetical protein
MVVAAVKASFAGAARPERAETKSRVATSSRIGGRGVMKKFTGEWLRLYRSRDTIGK